MIGHLGARVSALLDGQMSADESERAWAHVHTCHLCRDLVEREGWVKTRLAGLSFESDGAPDRLKGSLMGMPPGDVFLTLAQIGRAPESRARRHLGVVAIGGGAVGAAVMGVLALGAAPADAPSIDRRTPVTQLVTPSPTPASGPVRRTTP